MTRLIAILSAAVAAIGLGLGWFFVMRGPDDALAACGGGAVAGGTASIGGPFTLTNGAGARVTEADIVTRPTLIYFGYTFCPDFCPTDLARNAAAKEILAERGTDAGIVFISFDPERDTPDVAAEYAADIDPEAIGLSGSPEDVAAAAQAYRVYYRKASDEPGSYLMDHSTFTYLAAPGHPFLEFYSTEASPEQIADSVACYAGAL